MALFVGHFCIGSSLRTCTRRTFSAFWSEAGFKSVQIDGGFDGRPFEKDTDELVIEASLD